MATVKPAEHFNVEADCEKLRTAMKGAGTDENAIIEVIAHRSNEQRVEIVKKFKTMYGKDLIKDLRSELSGTFEHVVVSLMLSPAEFRAKELRDAMHGAGTSEEALIQVICTSTNKELQETREAYKRVYSRNLEEDIVKETSGYFQRLLVACLNANRNESDHIDHEKAKKLAETLYKSGAEKAGTDEAEFIRVLANESYPQLQEIFEQYFKIHGKTIEEVLKSELSGDTLRGFLAIARCAVNQHMYFAKALHDSMAGAGTRDHELSRVVVMRCEKDMKKIKEEFKKASGKTLEEVIEGDTSGDYKKLLIALVSGH